MTAPEKAKTCENRTSEPVTPVRPEALGVNPATQSVPSPSEPPTLVGPPRPRLPPLPSLLPPPMQQMSLPQLTDSPLSTRQLIWHVCQLCNIITCGLSTYLSIECLCRDLVNCELPAYMYTAGLSAHATLLNDMSTHLAGAVEALMQKPQHVGWLNSPSYRTLLKAANLLPRVVAWIPAPQYKRLPFATEVTKLREGAGEAATLMDGDANQGIEGWKGCWDDGQYLDTWE